MLHWTSISLLCLFVISVSDSLEGRDFMNLSQFQYSISDLFNEVSVKFANIPDVKMQIKCASCISIKPLKIKCFKNELVKANLEMKNEDIKISFPFNISCNVWNNARNSLLVSDIDSRPATNGLLISWKPPSNDIDHYLLIVMDSSRVYTNKILRETSYGVLNLKEKTWYQICIASIDRMWRTSRFSCIKAFTDFSKIGPVTNVKATAKSDSVSISWSRPKYEYDIIQGFIIYLQGITNQMCRLYIIKVKSDIDPTSQYSCVTTETITSSLSSLEIKDLPPNTEFSIEISSFVINKISAIKHLKIKTKEGESGPVQNVKIDIDRDPHKIHISFDAPINPAGIILKYRLRLILKRINICTQSNDVIHTEYSFTTSYKISKSDLKKCSSYILEVTPLNGWNSNDGVGKTTSVPFNYRQESSWTVNTKFISSNSLTVSIRDLKEVKCENFGFIIEMKDEKDHSNCLTRIISSLDCEAFKREINKTKSCAEQRFIQNLRQSSNYEFVISDFSPYIHEYSVTVYKITYDRYSESIQKERIKGETTVVVKETNNGKMKKIAFFVGLKKHIAHTTYTNDLVVFDELMTNVGNNYNKLTGEFTASVTGVYVFTVTISAQVNFEAAVTLVHNKKYIMDIWSSSKQWSSSTSQAILEIKKGDKVWIQYWKMAHYFYGEMYCTFSGYLLFELP